MRAAFTGRFFDYRYDRHRKIFLFAVISFLLFVIGSHAAHASVTIDPTVSTGGVTHNGTTFTNVFTSDQIGYAFYRDSDGSCVYKKTTNGGTNWSTSSISVDPQTDCVRIAIWYDQWSPDNTTGTLIHLVTMDTSDDDLWYNYLDTSGDALGTSTPVMISTGQGPSFAAGTNLQSITRATNGVLFAAVQDQSDSYAVRCASNCLATSSWSEATPTPFDNANDWLLLMPLPQGNILATRWDISANDVQSKIWYAASSSWATSWTDIDTGCSNNGTYDGHFGATLNDLSNDIYLAYGCDMQAIGGTNDDIRTAIFSGSSSTWTLTADAITDTTYGLTGVKIGLDSNTGNIYVVYSARTTAGTANTANVYYKVSTSTTMGSWGRNRGP